MSFWTFVFLCVVVGVGYDIWRKKQLASMGHWEDEKGRVAPLNSAREAELQQEITELRERVKVLERIATDDSEPRRLAAEIEKLRSE